MEVPLPRLQKVGDELAPGSGHCSFSAAHTFSTFEVSIAPKTARSRSQETQQQSKGLRRKHQ
jgi:hypothetical protein